MQSLNQLIARLLIVVVALALTGAPQMVLAQSQPPNQQPTPEDQGVPSVAYPAQNQAPTPGATEDPSKGPLEPIPPSTQPQLPENPAPQPQVTGTPQAPPVASPNAPAAAQNPPSQPVGTATAESAPTAGGAASKPAGTAIAPAKQRQVRSLLIKMGAVAGAAVALGTVFALSKGTPSVPPGAK
jgi:cytoskeletal protein RodZ